MRVFLSFLSCILMFCSTGSLYSQSFGYVANNVGGNITIIDIDTNVAVGYVDNNSFDITHPVQIKFTPDATKAYLVSDTVNSVFIIDPTLNKIIGKVDDTLFPFSAPSSIDITPDSLKAYVTNEASSQVSIIDLTTETVIGNVNVGAFPFNLPVQVIIDPVGVKAYVTNFNGANVSVIDVATDTVTQYVTNTVLTPFSNPFRIGFVDTTKVYITNLSGGSAQGVSIVDYATDTVTGYVNPSIYPFLGPENILIGDVPPRAYIENHFTSQVSIVDLTTDTVIGYYPYLTFSDPDSAHLTFDGQFLYVANAGSNIVNVINAVTTLPITNVNDSAFPFNGPISIDMSPLIVPPPPPPPLPTPTNAKGVKKEIRFASQTEFVNIITWDPPLTTNIVVAYRIYLDGLTDLIYTVPMCAPLNFVDHNICRGHTYNYFIVAVYANDTTSPPAVVSLTWECR